MFLLCTNKQIHKQADQRCLCCRVSHVSTGAPILLPHCLSVCLRAPLAWRTCLQNTGWFVAMSQQRSVSAEHLRNGAYTPSYASPQLLEHMGSGHMPAMNDVANDIWALGAVLFELSASAEPSWMHKYGPLMFGPRPKDLKKCMSGTRDQQITCMRKAIQREHARWVGSFWHTNHFIPS